MTSTNRAPSRRSLLAGLAFAPSLAAAPKPRFVSLFDGLTLKGWNNPYPALKAWVEKGEICLLSEKPVWLVHEGIFGDFVLEVDLRVPDGGNSGVQFRSQIDRTRLYGYQAEIDTSSRRWSGGLYDQGRRAWLGSLEGKSEAQAAYKNNQWNRVRVECIADHIRIWMNDVPTIDYIDPLDLAGHVAFQHHGNFQGHPAEVYRFKNIRIQSMGQRRWLSAAEAGLAWKGEGTAGWREYYGRTIWRPSAETIVSAQGFPSTDFTLRFLAKPIEGDAALVLEHAPEPIYLALTPDDRFGLLCRAGMAPLAPPSQPASETPFAAAIWNSVVLSSRAGRFVVHVNGVRRSEWPHSEASPVRAAGLRASRETHLEIKDFELMST
jgi:hypothetical protein